MDAKRQQRLGGPRTATKADQLADLLMRARTPLQAIRDDAAAVANFYHSSFEVIAGAGREARVSAIRAAAIAVCVERGYREREIGAVFGVTRGAIGHAVRRVAAMRETVRGRTEWELLNRHCEK